MQEFQIKNGGILYPTIKNDEDILTQNSEKAEAFNKFFLSHSNISNRDADLPPNILSTNKI